MADRMVVITHKGGGRVAVTPHDYHHVKVGPEGETYADLGWKIERYEDGQPYEAPTRATPSEEPKKSKPSGD